MVGLRVWSLVLVGIAACGYPQPDPVGVGFGADDDDDASNLPDPDGPPPDADIDAPPVDAMPDAPPGFVGTVPSSSGATVAISGKTDVGQKLTAVPSGFNLGSPAAGYHYQWQRSSSTSFTSPVNVGADSNTYTLTTADAPSTMYIRVIVTATNACDTGCGSSSPVASSAHGPVRRALFSKGAQCSLTHCTSSACHWYTLQLIGFSSSSHTLTCFASNVTVNPDHSFSTYSTSSNPATGHCCYGYIGKTAWMTADDLKSNTVTW